ncbi:hypothetical protein D3C74_382780 [compost metagenome]
MLRRTNKRQQEQDAGYRHHRTGDGGVQPFSRVVTARCAKTPDQHAVPQHDAQSIGQQISRRSRNDQHADNQDGANALKGSDR